MSLFSSHYSPHDIDSELVEQELIIFNVIIAANKESLCVNTRSDVNVPNLTKLADIGLILPMSTVDCERGFSMLSCIKTDLRNRLNIKGLNYLLLTSIEGPIPSIFPYKRACNLQTEI